MDKMLYTLFSAITIIGCSSPENETDPTLIQPSTTEYSLTVSSGPGGTVSTSGGAYEEGSTVNVTATPNSEYIFQNWSNGLTDNPLTVMMNQNITLTANFIKRKYPLTINILGEGTVREEIVSSGKSTTTEYNSGTVVRLTADPNSGWLFQAWSGSVSSTSDQIEFEIDESKTLNVVFNQLAEYQLEIGAGEGGAVITSGGTYYQGSTVTIDAVPDDGYVFWEWSDNVQQREREIVINSDSIIHAVFRNKYQIEDGAYKAVGYVNNGELITSPSTMPLIFEFENNNVVLNGMVYNDLASFGIYKSVGLIYGEHGNDYGLENVYLSRDTIHRSYFVGSGAKQSWGLIKIDEIPNDYSHDEIMELLEGKGFWSDPIYSQINPLDPKSYVLAFIDDAERHGVDLSFVDPNKITVNFRDSGNAGLSHLYCQDDDRVEISYVQSFWDGASYYDLYNERITVMWHELGHDLLNSAHPVEGSLNQIMNQNLVESGLPKWDDSDPMFSFRRMVDDMFSGIGLYYTCNNSANDYSSEP